VSQEHPGQLAEGRVLDRADLLVAIPLDALDRLELDLERAGVLLDALAREDLGADDRALDAGRHAQRGVAHIACLLAEDRAQELLFGGELGLALRA
jgi:hypothetical protein